MFGDPPRLKVLRFAPRADKDLGVGLSMRVDNLLKKGRPKQTNLSITALNLH